jgi:hypothetical protein
LDLILAEGDKEITDILTQIRMLHHLQRLSAPFVWELLLDLSFRAKDTTDILARSRSRVHQLLDQNTKGLPSLIKWFFESQKMHHLQRLLALFVWELLLDFIPEGEEIEGPQH